MAKFTTVKNQECGIVLGGLGTGSVELYPDGEFHQWQIANIDKWAFSLNGKGGTDGDEHTGALSFWVRTQIEGETPVVRKLGMQTAQKDFRYCMFAWNKPIEKIEFDGRFPVAELQYVDGALPVDLSMKAISPFVPHNEKDSATPGFYMDFEISNTSDKSLTASIMSVLRPTFCNDGGCVNNRYTDGDVTGIYLDSPLSISPDEAKQPNRGSLCYSAEGGDITYITAEHTRFTRGYIASSKFGSTEESVLFRFRKTGELPNTEVGKAPTRITGEISEMSDDEIDKYVAEMQKYPFAQSFCDRARYVRPAYPSTREEKEFFLAGCKRSMEKLGDEFGACALCSKVTLNPGETKKVRFILSWYFPNHTSKFGEILGHQYENYFANAKEVNKYLSCNRHTIADKACAFADLLYRTNLPYAYPESWSGQLSTIVKDSWYLKSGKFALWEGFSSCGFHTTDITYQASFSLLAIFPRLQLGQMEMGVAFQREDGRVHHLFSPDLDHVDNGYNRVDMNNQFVLLVCRDYLHTGDRGYLERLWIPVQKAMDSIQLLDTDGDGLPDKGTEKNTYDAWKFSGTPVYISILWLSALKAGIRLAEVMGDLGRKKQWQAILDKGTASLETRLWNGKYYDLWRRDTEDGVVIDRSLMSDQISGEWFLRVSGIGTNLPDWRVCDILNIIFENNFDFNFGLVNATFPKGQPVSLDTYENCQAGIIWTGIGYTFAALALSMAAKNGEQMERISHAIMENTHENQLRCGMLWNHEESGFRYTRPLSSWTTMIAACGLKMDAENKVLSMTPYNDGITLPLCTCEHLGTVQFSENECNIILEKGSLAGWNVFANGKNGQLNVKVRNA